MAVSKQCAFEQGIGAYCLLPRHFIRSWHFREWSGILRNGLGSFYALKGSTTLWDGFTLEPVFGTSCLLLEPWWANPKGKIQNRGSTVQAFKRLVLTWNCPEVARGREPAAHTPARAHCARWAAAPMPGAALLPDHGPVLVLWWECVHGRAVPTLLTAMRWCFSHLRGEHAALGDYPGMRW